MVSLHTGMPNPDMFPFTSIDVALADGTKIKVQGEALRRRLQYLPTRDAPINRLID